MSSFIVSQLPSKPTNLILTGVAGTGKTHHLLHIQRLYDETVTLPTHNVAQQLLADIGWREVVCAVLLLENRSMRVAEIVQHALFQAKAAANGRSDNLLQTASAILQHHTVNNNQDKQKISNLQKNKPQYVADDAVSTKASASYFVQSSDKSWYLLDAVKPSLTQSLSELTTLAQMLGVKHHNNDLSNPHGNISKPDTQATNYLLKSHTLSRSTLVSFHQAYGYDEFVEGIRPQLDENSGQMRYRIVAGAFLELCQRAKADPNHRYAMLIDELNRANVAQVFGELMSVIESDKRAGQRNALTVRLAYSGQMFSVPSNVDIYATMNTQDRSLVALDMAFRRRFEFIEMLPDASILPVLQDKSQNEVDLAQLLQTLNTRIMQQLGTEAVLGHAFLCDVTTMRDLAKVMARQILPQLITTIEAFVRMDQVAGVMQSILYGHDVLTHIDSVDYPLVHSVLSQNSTHIQIAPALLIAAQSPDLSLTNTQPNHQDNVCVYLSAAPYQQIYKYL
ncbi:McrB family protein [Psychrobacter sp. I-STPA10]|uniref:McrB family protein n=1 Tax=Psychrobacter sp. I-STPA10 TaxID=2585769 RepID=UPI001E5BDC3A|nr:AAA family ATPase [Psychrobacter sp. I-STPA10]